MIIKKNFKQILIIALMLVSLPLKADILWNINGSGLTAGTISGSFAYNQITTAIYNVSLNASGFGAGFDTSISGVNPSSEFVSPPAYGNFVVNVPGSVFGVQIPNAQAFFFNFMGDLSSTGPINLINFTSQITGGNNFSTVPFSGTFTQGTVSSVPVPATVWLFGSALTGLISFTRRKTLQQGGLDISARSI